MCFGRGYVIFDIPTGCCFVGYFTRKKITTTFGLEVVTIGDTPIIGSYQTLKLLPAPHPTPFQ